jgi:adenine specific DNA methylase Mod
MKEQEKKSLQQEITRLQAELSCEKKRLSQVNYGLTWLDVEESLEHDLSTKTPILNEIETKELGKTQTPIHKLLVGDNLHSLTCLAAQRPHSVDVIYIDPPYNTGSLQFQYKDRRVKKTLPDGSKVLENDAFLHNDWISFMSKRLELSKKILAETGCIFLSINESEYGSLKLLCDKIYGESNYMTTFTVKVRHEERILKGDKDYHETTELLLLYRKSPKFKTIKRELDNSSIEKYVYSIKELNADPKTIVLDGKRVEVFEPGDYKIIKHEPLKTGLQKINIRGSLKEGNSSGRFHMKHFESLNDNFDVLYKVPGMGDDHLDHRYFLSRKSAANLNGFYFQGVPLNRKETKMIPHANLLDFEEDFNNVGYEGGVVFRNGKKPVNFLKHILALGTDNKNAVILDFFAGSGSTGEAVIQLNHLDKGNRTCILCTSNESNIAEEITYKRLKNVLQGYELTRNKKLILFQIKLTARIALENDVIKEAYAKFLSKKFQDQYDKITTEVKNDQFTIYGWHLKNTVTPVIKQGLKFYETGFK